MKKISLPILTTVFLLAGMSIEYSFGQTIYHTARYCESEAAAWFFNNHTDEFVIDYSLPCWNGATFDANVGEYTKDIIDVIFIGGDNTFSNSTALAIEEAVFNDKKVFLLGFWSNRNFDASLPAVNAGDANYGNTLTVEDPEHPIFAGLPTVFYNSGPDYNRELAIEKIGSTVLLRFDNGDPALLYWKYGKGYVIEWTLECMHLFMDEPVLDSINYRLLKLLLNELSQSSFGLYSPNGGEYWQYGTQHPISWTTGDSTIEKITIRLSYDSGNSYNDLLFENIINDGEELWTVPEAQCNTARIKIEGFDAQGVLVGDDESNGDFCIYTTPPVYLDSGLVALYPFNGNANDESGNNNDGIVQDAILTTDRFGIANAAYDFNGSDNHISIPVDINFNALPQLTMVAWVNPSNEDGTRTIISHDNGLFDKSIIFNGNGYCCYTGTGAVGYFPVVVGSWVLLAVTYDQSTSTAEFFMNTSSVSGATSFNMGWPYTWIGGNPSYGEYFCGKIDDVRIYDRLLNEFEIQALYHEGDWGIKPTFTVVINNQEACKGDSIGFVTMVEGIPPITLQWQKDGIDMPGATDSILIIPGAQAEDEGIYQCIGTNEYGTGTSNPAWLAVEFAIPTDIQGFTDVLAYQVATYSIHQEEGHVYEFSIGGGNAIDWTANSVTVHWGTAGKGTVILLETSDIGCVADTNTLEVTIGNLSINEMENQDFIIYPNPATDEVIVSVSGLRPLIDGHVTLTICDLYGHEVRVLVDEAKSPGEFAVRMEVSALPAGVYLVRLQGGGKSAVRKLVVR